MTKKERLGRVWGMTESERALTFPCDALLDPADDVLYRGVSVRAPAPVVFRWLCQLRVAPYSYDWIDNFGRRSPQRWIPGLEQLATGQRVMSIFTLVSFEAQRHITLRITPNTAAQRVFGDVVGTYWVSPQGEQSRLLCKLRARYPRGLWGELMRRLLPLGDLIMMRRQLLNLKRLAESTRASELEPAVRAVAARAPT
jgi:hypothetical protein